MVEIQFQLGAPRKLRKTGSSISITLPGLFVKSNDLKQGQMVMVHWEGNLLRVTPVKDKKELT